MTVLKVRKVSVWNGRRYGARYEAKFGDLTATAPTEKEAKEQVLALAEQALTGTYTPTFVRHGDVLMVSYRTQYGWMYCLTRETEGSLDYSACANPNTTGPEMDRQARRHMAGSYLPEGTGVAVLRNADDIAMYRSNLAWQARYQEAKAQGMSDYQAHAHAGDCTSD